MKTKILECNGYKASVMKAEKLTGDYTHQLPPGIALDAYPVDMFKEPLSHWIGGSGSYVIPIEPGDALWFDWQKNDAYNTAILPTIKGMNPITGRRTEGFKLEKYTDKCPVHDINFGGERYCPECDLKWPSQNYIAAPNTLWWDGFLDTKDGVIRQFLFTEDLSYSMPEQIIGKDDTIPAFGFAFYKTKKHREVSLNRINDKSWEYVSPPKYMHGVSCNCYTCQKERGIWYSWGTSSGSLVPGITTTNGFVCDSIPITSNYFCNVSNSLARGNSVLRSSGAIFTASAKIREDLSDKEVGIGAGAKINQNIFTDELDIHDWKETPESVIRIYFVFTAQFNEISVRGMKDFSGKKNGYLNKTKLMSV